MEPSVISGGGRINESQSKFRIPKSNNNTTSVTPLKLQEAAQRGNRAISHKHIEDMLTGTSNQRISKSSYGNRRQERRFKPS
jgi:hypothetical protein